MVWQSLLGPYIFVMLCQTLAAAVFSYCSFMALSTSGFVCKWNAALLQKQSQCGIFHFLIFQNLFTDLGNSPSVLWCAKELPLGMRLNTDCNTLYFWHLFICFCHITSKLHWKSCLSMHYTAFTLHPRDVVCFRLKVALSHICLHKTELVV